MFWLSWVTADGGYFTQILPGVVLTGIGMGFSVVPLNNLALYRVGPHDAEVEGAGAGAVEAMAAGHRTVFAAGAAISALIAVVAWFGLRPRPDGGVEPSPIGADGAENDFLLAPASQ